MNRYDYIPFTSRIKDCQVIILHGKLYYYEDTEEGQCVEKQQSLIASTCNDGWGQVTHHDIMNLERWRMPHRLTLRYLTMTDGAIYDIDTQLDECKADELWGQQLKEYPDDPFHDYVVGTGPFGIIAIWLSGHTRSVLLQTLIAKKSEYNDLEQRIFGWTKEGPDTTPIKQKDFEDDMKQYYYRYICGEEHFDLNTMKWVEYNDDDPVYDNLDIVSIEDMCTDGSYNYMDDDICQQQYHPAGKPRRITVRWYEGHTKYLAHFWINGHDMSNIFKQFFKSESEKKADILLRIDPDMQEYQMALRDENKAHELIVPWYAYQLVVFKDGEEHFKSPNYQLADGEWSWLYKKPEEDKGNDSEEKKA